MNTHKRPEGIAGLVGRPPIGADVTMGRKVPGGGVTAKDCFHIVEPRENEQGVKPYIVRFSAFNGAKPEFRRSLSCALVYKTRAQSFTYNVGMRAFPKAYSAPRARPNMAPVCQGDGKRAIRWTQHEDENKEIVCPNDQCQFRQSKDCRPYSQIIFQLRWAKGDMPTPICRLTSKGWGTAINLLGFFDQLTEQATELGLEDPSYYGFPFTMQLVQRTKPRERRKWWEIVVTPEQDIVSFFQWQKERLAELQAPLAGLSIPDLRDVEEEPYDAIGELELGDNGNERRG